MITVLIVDDEALVRYGFELILSTGSAITVVATCDGDGAVDAIREHRPDVVLLDIRMPGTSGIDVLRAAAAEPERPAVAMLTTFDGTEHLSEALQLGADGFLVKDIEPEALVEAVRVLARGGLVLAPGIDRRSLFGRAAGEEAPTADEFSERELAVIRLVADGATNNEIGARLFVSLSTVKEDLKNVAERFGVGSRVEIALAAAKSGLLDES